MSDFDFDKCQQDRERLFGNRDKYEKAFAAGRASVEKIEVKAEYTTGHCANHAVKGGCQLPNVQCGYPECDRKKIEAAPSQEPVKRFDCWSHDDGDSWFENPADADIIYDLLGESPKVGDEYEVYAGWNMVDARYRIVEINGDDMEVECISHPNETYTNPAPSAAAQIESLMVQCKAYSEKCAEYTKQIAKLEAEAQRINKWADEFTDAHLKERKNGDALLKEKHRELTNSLEYIAHANGRIEMLENVCAMALEELDADGVYGLDHVATALRKAIGEKT